MSTFLTVLGIIMLAAATIFTAMVVCGLACFLICLCEIIVKLIKL